MQAAAIPLSLVILRRLVRVDGSVEELPKPVTIEGVSRLIDAQTLDVIALHDALKHVLLVDDNGYAKGLPVNTFATLLYRMQSGGKSIALVLGDCVLCPDEDFSTPTLEADFGL